MTKIIERPQATQVHRILRALRQPTVWIVGITAFLPTILSIWVLRGNQDDVLVMGLLASVALIFGIIMGSYVYHANRSDIEQTLLGYTATLDQVATGDLRVRHPLKSNLHLRSSP